MPQPSILLIHGEATGAWLWDTWRLQLRALGWEANVIDLRGHGLSLPVDFSTISLQDYIRDVASVTQQIEAAQGVHPILAGWGMGGLVSLLLAAEHDRLPDLATMPDLEQPRVPALLLFSPSLSREVGPRASLAEQRNIPLGPVGPQTFGIFPADPVASREALFDLTDAEATAFLQRSAGAEESGLVARQMRRQISIPADALEVPTLLVYGDAGPGDLPQLQQQFAEHLEVDTVAVPGAGHYGVVYSAQAVAQAAPQVDLWLRRVLN